MKRAAIVGLGWWGGHIIRQLKASSLLEVVLAVGNRPPQQSIADEHGLRFTLDLEDALRDPGIDIIILTTPHMQHVEQIRRAAEAGKHVFCEKPVAMEVSQADVAIKACRDAGVRLGIGHERRFEPAMDEIRTLLACGALGTIMHAEANFSHDKLRNLPNENWRVPEKGDPPLAMTGTGIHITDAFIELLGPISQVCSLTATRVAFPPEGDVLSVQMKFASGATGALNAVLVTPFYARMAIFGSEAWLEVRNSTHPEHPGTTSFTFQPRDAAQVVRELPWRDPVRANLEAFARSIDGMGIYPFTDTQVVENVAVLEAVTRSVQTGLPEEVHPVVQPRYRMA